MVSTPQPQETRHLIAGEIIGKYSPITFEDTKEIFVYNKSTELHEPGETTIEAEIQAQLANQTSKTDVSEIIAIIQRKTFVNRNQIDEDNKNLVPLQNCILNIKTKEKIPYSDGEIFFHKHNITYNPEATEYPKIKKFLEEITKKESDITLLKEIIGYCFIKNYKFQYIFVFVGEGANGKSVLLNLLINMLGEQCICQKTLQLLTDYYFAPAALYGKNANIINDLPKKQFKDTGMLKALSGGDWVETEIKYKGSIKFQNHAKLIAACNEIPQSDDESMGFYRRFVIIEFPHMFEGATENKNLLEEITREEEKSAFFNACLTAYLEAEARGTLSYSATIEEKRKIYLNYSNSAKVFAEEELELNSNGEITKTDLWLTYLDFCQKNKIFKKPMVWFFRELYKYFGGNARQTRKDGVMRIQGISWRQKDVIFETGYEG